jgi:hypothetical protein
MTHARLIPDIIGPLIVITAVALAVVTPRARHEATVQRATLVQQVAPHIESWRVWECHNKPRDCYHGGRLRFILYTGGEWE